MTTNPIETPLRLLTLGPQPVWPATDGGREGIYGALIALAQQADVIYACPCPDPEPCSISHFEDQDIDYRPVDYRPEDTVATIASSTLQLKPFKFHKYGNRQAFRSFRDQLLGVQADAILCFHAHMLEMGFRLRNALGLNVPILLREHNIEFELVESYRASLSLPQRLVAAPFSWLTRQAEMRGWETADATLFLSDGDFDFATASGRVANPVLAREGVPIPPRRNLMQSASSRALLLPFNPKATQNIGNVMKFLNEFWRLAAPLEEMSDISLKVTGVDAEQLANFTGMSASEQQSLRVDALGFLPDLSMGFDMTTAVVSPTFVGGGIRKKMLEGMANQMPVIATDHDIQTCKFLKASENIVRLGSLSDFVNNVRMLVDDRGFWQRISENGRATVEKFASWDSFASTAVGEVRRLQQLRAGGL